MSEKSKQAVVAVGMVAFAGWGITYVPVLSDTLPSLISAPTQTVNLDVGDLSSNDLEAGTLPAGLVSEACRHIPFLLRPIADKPRQVRVVLNDGALDIGEGVYDCSDGSLISDRIY